MSNTHVLKVIKIIDDYSIVINGGHTDDIEEGDKIEIFLTGEEIKDPYNDDEVLGTLDFIKEKLEVTQVFARFSICEKIKREKVTHPTSFQQAMMAIPNLNLGKREIKVTREKINIDETEISGWFAPIIETTKVVKLGDNARVSV